MSSEAITQNDLREILSRTVGSVPSEFKKLLWTNPSPTTAFNAQTVSLDLTNYDVVEVEAKTGASIDQYTTHLFDVGGGGIITNFQLNDTWYMRQMTVNSTGIIFANGRYCYMSNGGNGVLDSVCIPTKIYGIRYERVEPPQLEADIETLATDITIIRVGNLRVLKCKSAVYSTIKSITLATSDRPPTRIEFTGIKHAGGMYATLGLGYIETTGAITAVYWGGYSGSAYPTSLVNSDNFTGDAIWYVTD